MRIQVLSDLHMELQGEMPLPDPGADVVVLAGDIAAGADGVAWAGRTWSDRPVICVLGNHEYYGGDVEQVLAEARDAARGTSVHVLERESAVIGGVYFLGATLWSDFALHGADFACSSRDAARRDMPDFQLIAHEGAPLAPETTVEWHRSARTWLERELAPDRAGTTVVVSHHAPHPRSNHYADDPMSPAFVSDLSAMIEHIGPSVWIHGHTHTSEDYWVGNTRVVANQAGYAGEPTGWDPHWTIDVAT